MEKKKQTPRNETRALTKSFSNTKLSKRNSRLKRWRVRILKVIFGFSVLIDRIERFIRMIRDWFGGS